eukprot:353556-Chlamydomonas_euryale.AAC.2
MRTGCAGRGTGVDACIDACADACVDGRKGHMPCPPPSHHRSSVQQSGDRLEHELDARGRALRDLPSTPTHPHLDAAHDADRLEHELDARGRALHALDLGDVVLRQRVERRQRRLQHRHRLRQIGLTLVLDGLDLGGLGRRRRLLLGYDLGGGEKGWK